MKKKSIILIIFLVILITGIGTVSAETLSGTLGSSGLNTSSYSHAYQATGGQTVAAISNLYITDIQNTRGISYLIRYDITAIPTYTAGSPVGNTTPVIFKIGSDEIGTGTFGYQRSFNGAGTEQLGYQYLIFNSDWAGATDYTGSQTVTIQGIPINGITYTISALNNVAPASGKMKFGTSANGWFGNYDLQRDTTFFNEYIVSKPSGIGITGNISKLSGGTTYPGRAWIFDGTYGTTIANELTTTNTTFNFTTANQTIKIGVQDGDGTWYNTSTLFTTGYGTPTPTPTPVPGATIAPGYVRTYAHIKDRSGNMIHGPNIQIKDIEGGAWSNSSSDADGIHYIDTLPGHVVNIYADYTIFANEFLPGSLLTQPCGTTYYLTLYPYESGAGTGTVSLYVEVKEPSGSFIPYANVQITLPNGTSYAGSTANAGSKVFLVPNDTQIRATGSASGYLPATEIGNSGTEGGSTTMTITLNRQTVTASPTTTIPPGGVTPAVTFDARTDNQKDIDMMNKIRDAGPTLIDLAIAVTMISLLGLMAKGFK